MGWVQDVLRRGDRIQGARPWLAFPFAVLKKAGEDRVGQLAALTSYYGFLSLFPLVLSLVTVLSFVLGNDPELRARLVDSALVQFPIVGDQIRQNVGTIRGSAVALVAGLLVALWGGMGIFAALQFAMNSIWDVPMKERPGFLPRVLRSAVGLGVLAGFVVASSVLAGFAAFAWGSTLSRVLAVLGSVAMNTALAMVAFRHLTVRRLRWRDVLPGAALVGPAFFGLQTLGGFIVDRQLRHATALYGFFGVVLGLLAWLYVSALVFLYAGEVNVVRARRLWPRSLVEEEPNPTDERALEASARVEERLPQERIEVAFDGPADPRERPAPEEHPER